MSNEGYCVAHLMQPVRLVPNRFEPDLDPIWTRFGPDLDPIWGPVGSPVATGWAKVAGVGPALPAIARLLLRDCQLFGCRPFVLIELSVGALIQSLVRFLVGRVPFLQRRDSPRIPPRFSQDSPRILVSLPSRCPS